MSEIDMESPNKVEDSLNPGPSNKGRNRLGSEEGSIYCSVESFVSDVEIQLKKDLILAQESASEQRQRANGLEGTVKRLEAIIDRVSKQSSSSGVEELLERKNEKLEKKLCAVLEQATIEKQASGAAHLKLWRLEKELDKVKSEKETIESARKELQGEIDGLTRQVKENEMVARTREERITELQNDLTALKQEMTTERNKWQSIETKQSKDMLQIINENKQKIKMEIALDDCRSKVTMFEKQKNILSVENEKLMQKLRKAEEAFENSMDDLADLQQTVDALNKNNEVLKGICSLQETQLLELEAKYITQMQMNEEHNASIDKLRNDIRDRDAKMMKLQQNISKEEIRKVKVGRKSSEMSNELTKLTNALKECKEKIIDLEKSVSLAEEKNEDIQRINKSLKHENKMVKEENSKLLTDLFLAKDNYRKLHERYDDLKRELTHLNETNAELIQIQTQNEILAEAKLTQCKDIIDCLQKRVDEMSQKKKSLAGVIFGSSKKENM